MPQKPTTLKTLALASLSALALCSSFQAQAANIAIGTGSFYTENLKNQLIAAGHTVTELATYTAAQLASFDSFIAYGNMDSYDFGQLEIYALSGGTVVETPWFWLNQSPTPNLDIFTHGGSTSPNDLLDLGLNYSELNPGVDVLDAGNPILAGVTFPGAGSTPIARTIGNTFVDGVFQIANWSDGTAFIGQRALGTGKVIGINLHVITSDTPYFVIDQNWAATLVCNAATGTACVVPPAPVPVPAAVWLLGSGLAGMVGAARRRKAEAAA